MNKRNLIAFTTPIALMAALHVTTANAGEATDIFEASLTVVADEPTCTFDVGSVDFGTATADHLNVEGDNSSTDFTIDFDCSQAVESASITFVRGADDSTTAWFLRSPGIGITAYRISDANNVALLPDIASNILISAGSQSLTYNAFLIGTVHEGVGEYTSTVDVVFTF